MSAAAATLVLERIKRRRPTDFSEESRVNEHDKKLLERKLTRQFPDPEEILFDKHGELLMMDGYHQSHVRSQFLKVYLYFAEHGARDALYTPSMLLCLR